MAPHTSELAKESPTGSQISNGSSRSNENVPSPSPLESSPRSLEAQSEYSEDEYITSDDEILSTVLSSDEQRHHFSFTASLSDHTDYFSTTLSNAMESYQLDKSLVAQAQLSGQINNKNQKLVEKNEELTKKLAELKRMCDFHLNCNRIGDLENDIKDLTVRLEALKKGSKKALLFGAKSKLGVADKYPVEYNQARDKVVERVET